VSEDRRDQNITPRRSHQHSERRRIYQGGRRTSGVTCRRIEKRRKLRAGAMDPFRRIDTLDRRGQEPEQETPLQEANRQANEELYFPPPRCGPTDPLDDMARGLQRAVLTLFNQAERKFLDDIVRNVLADGMPEKPKPDRRRGCTY
jgi:hypothetical protein